MMTITVAIDPRTLTVDGIGTSARAALADAAQWRDGGTSDLVTVSLEWPSVPTETSDALNRAAALAAGLTVAR